MQIRPEQLAVSALAGFLLAACSDPGAARVAGFGCGPVEGAEQLAGRHATKYILVGEFTETSEGPAAFAELACQLSAQGALFVGVIDYFGGATDSETKMRDRLAALAARGAPITVGLIGEEGREIDRRARTMSEQRWADLIVKKVETSGASRALLLLPSADAQLLRVAPVDERFAGYDPMPMHLPEGRVISLEIAKAEDGAAGPPAIRLRDQPAHGFHGELTLTSLTRPVLSASPVEPATRKPLASLSLDAIPAEQMERILAEASSREQRIDLIARALDSQGENPVASIPPDILPSIDFTARDEALRRRAALVLDDYLDWKLRQPDVIPAEMLKTLMDGAATREEQVNAVADWLYEMSDGLASAEERRFEIARDQIDDPFVVDLYRPNTFSSVAGRRTTAIRLAGALVDGYLGKIAPDIAFDPATIPDLELAPAPAPN